MSDSRKKTNPPPAKGKGINPKFGAASARRKAALSELSLIQQLKLVDLNEAILQTIFDKMVAEHLTSGAQFEVSVKKPNQFTLIYKGKNLIQEGKDRQDYVDKLLALKPEEVSAVAAENPGWEESFQVWKKNPSMTKAKTLLGLDPNLHDPVKSNNWGKLSYFRDLKTSQEIKQAAKAAKGKGPQKGSPTEDQ